MGRRSREHEAWAAHAALTRRMHHEHLDSSLRFWTVVWRELEHDRAGARSWEEDVADVRTEENGRINADDVDEGLRMTTEYGGECRSSRIGGPVRMVRAVARSRVGASAFIGVSAAVFPAMERTGGCCCSCCVMVVVR